MKRLLPALLLLAVLPAQAEIYKWVDENGRTHFGEVVPDKYRKAATTLNPQPANTIQGSTLRGKLPAGDRRDEPPAAAAAAPAPASIPASAAEQCRAAQERYRRSQECFARYRNANGSLKVEAGQNCEDVPQPPACD